MDKVDKASPTVSTTALFITAMVDSKERRKVSTRDAPNAFIQTNQPLDEDDQRVILKIQGPLVDMLMQIAPEVCKQHVQYEKNKKVLCVKVLKAIYGLLRYCFTNNSEKTWNK